MTTDRNHLDAETVAAWLDGGLDATSLAAAQAHASNCDRCQALLATAARTLPADAPVVSGFSRMWRWWLAPVAAAAAAVTLWMVVPQEPMRAPASHAPASDMAQRSTEPTKPSPSPEPPPAVAQAPQPVPAAPAADARFGESRRNVPRADAAAKAKVAETQANKDIAPMRDRQEVQQEKREENLARAAPAPAAPAAAPAEGAALGANQLRKQVASLEFVSPDPNRRWRAVTPGTIEFSQDRGNTWIPVRLNPSELVTGGASPAPLVCWIVGRAGVVLLATDGTNFTRLPFPERIDLVTITAADARRATVTTADGRTFQTVDNGRNWRNP